MNIVLFKNPNLKRIYLGASCFEDGNFPEEMLFYLSNLIFLYILFKCIYKCVISQLYA